MGRRKLSFRLKTIPKYGFQNQETLYINETQYNNFSYLKIIERLNEMSSFEIRLDAMSDSQKTDITTNKVVKFFNDNNFLYKGKIKQVTYQEDEAFISGFGPEIDLVESEVERLEYTDTASSTIIGNLLAVNKDNSAPWLMSKGTINNIGDISVRGDYTNRLNFISMIAKNFDYDWYVDTTGHPYNTDRFNFVSSRGSSDVATFKTSGGDDQNASLANEIKDNENVINYIKVLGYGDGINQLSTSFFAASNVFDNLDGELSASATTVTVDSTSGFSSSGIIIIGEEAIPYTGTSGTTFTGCVRDSDSLDGNGLSYARIHPDNVLVFEYYDGDGSDSSTLDGAIDDDDTTISLADASSFASSGAVIIGKEVITYSGKSTNDLTGCTRGARGSTATEHTNGFIVFEYDNTKHYTPYDNSSLTGGSPKSSSSINTEGLKEKTVVDKGISKNSVAQTWASYVLTNKKDAVYRRTLTLHDIRETTVNIGDTITVEDTSTGMDTTYQVVGRERVINYDGEDHIMFELSNKRVSFSTTIAEVINTKKVSESFGLGSTVLYIAGPSVLNMETPSSDTANPAPGSNTLFFPVPDDVINLNSVKLHYRLMNPIVDAKTTASGSSHSHSLSSSVNNHNHDGTTGGGGGSVLLGTSTFSALLGTTITESQWTHYPVAIISAPSSATARTYVTISVWSADANATNGDELRFVLSEDSSGTPTVRSNYGHVYLPDDPTTPVTTTLISTRDWNANSEAVHLWIYGYDINDAGNQIDIKFEGSGCVEAKHDHDLSSSSNNHNHSGTTGESSHTHNMSFDIQTRTYGISDIRILTTDNANSSNPTWTDRTSAVEAVEGTLANSNGSVENNIELKDFFSSTSSLKGVRLCGTGNGRSYLQLSIKAFVESKKV